MLERILIAGASARSAAQSAQRAGLTVFAADLFDDQDLACCEQSFRVQDYPQGLLHIARQLPPMQWVYTGGLENEPELVDAISRHHVLLGNPGDVLRRVRNPWTLFEVLRREQLCFPEPRRRLPSDLTGTWLCKPLRSCGGARIYLADAAQLAADDNNRFYQPLIPGVSHGTVFVADGRRAALLGTTRQLVGCPWAGAKGFQYVGSVGPVELSPSLRDQMHRIGNCLAREFKLRGLFGVDTIVEDDRAWTVEVNPRFTASVEILERSLGFSAINRHRKACRTDRLPDGGQSPVTSFHGKAIAFAEQEFVVGDRFFQRLSAGRTDLPIRGLADLPHIGAKVAVGRPILTVFADGTSCEEVEALLHRRVRQVQNAAR